jgi:hypothetical protein
MDVDHHQQAKTVEKDVHLSKALHQPTEPKERAENAES